jgi:hypothetical protein
VTEEGEGAKEVQIFLALLENLDLSPLSLFFDHILESETRK